MGRASAPRGASSPLAKGQDLSAKPVCNALGTSRWRQVTPAYGCWVVACLVLSPAVGRVVRCREDDVVGMAMAGLGNAAVGEEGLDAKGMLG